MSRWTKAFTEYWFGEEFVGSNCWDFSQVYWPEPLEANL